MSDKKRKNQEIQDSSPEAGSSDAPPLGKRQRKHQATSNQKKIQSTFKKLKDIIAESRKLAEKFPSNSHNGQLMTNMITSTQETYDCRRMKNNKIVIVGDQGIGKSHFCNCISPWQRRRSCFFRNRLQIYNQVSHLLASKQR